MPAAQPLQGADVRPGSVCLTVGDLHLLVVPTELVRLQGGSRQQQGARAGHGQQPLAHGLARLGVVSGVVDPVAEPAVPTRRARVVPVPVPVGVAVMTTALVGPLSLIHI